jgi:hypothetical protein
MEERINLDELDTARGAEAGFDLKLKSPDGRELPGALRIRGTDSATYQRVLDDQQRRRLGRMTMSKTPTVEDIVADTQELLAALVIGWSCPFNLEGKPLDYSPENARILLRRFSWIREQVDRAASVRANFLPGSSAS